jgi:hypothetical protein
LLLEVEHRLLEATADKEVILVDDDDCLVDDEEEDCLADNEEEDCLADNVEEDCLVDDEEDCLADDEEDCLANEDDVWVDAMILIVVSDLSEEVDLLKEMLEVLFVLAVDGFDDDMGGAIRVLLELLGTDVDLEEENVELEETTVAACRELKTEIMEEATAEVLTKEVEVWVLLADLSCGLAE